MLHSSPSAAVSVSQGGGEIEAGVEDMKLFDPVDSNGLSRIKSLTNTQTICSNMKEEFHW
jgi:hypothetical protein